jgi:hypothetical protein
VNSTEGFLPVGAKDTGLPVTLGGSTVVPDYRREVSAAQTTGEHGESTTSTGAVQQSIRAKILGSAGNAERSHARRLPAHTHLSIHAVLSEGWPSRLHT